MSKTTTPPTAIDHAVLNSVLTGQGKLEKVREFVWSGKDQGKILFLKIQGK